MALTWKIYVSGERTLRGFVEEEKSLLFPLDTNERHAYGEYIWR